MSINCWFKSGTVFWKLSAELTSKSAWKKILWHWIATCMIAGNNYVCLKLVVYHLTNKLSRFFSFFFFFCTRGDLMSRWGNNNCQNQTWRYLNSAFREQSGDGSPPRLRTDSACATSTFWDVFSRALIFSGYPRPLWNTSAQRRRTRPIKTCHFSHSPCFPPHPAVWLVESLI